MAMSLEECTEILGVSPTASREEIIAARRRLAREFHPDAGGSHSQMTKVNEAFRVLSAIAARQGSERPGSTDANPREGCGEPAVDIESQDESAQSTRRRGFRDAPSFVINALPVDAFEVLLVAAASLGEVVDEDPPYLLEVLVREPGPVWCRFELVPDAGSTTVILSCDVEAGFRVYSPEEIRDLWISTINS